MRRRAKPVLADGGSWRGVLLTAAVARTGGARGWFVSQNLDLMAAPCQWIVGATASPADNWVGAAVWATAKMFGPFGVRVTAIP